MPACLLSRSSLPGSSVPGTLRAGILEGVARPFSSQQSIGIYVIPILQMKRLRLSVGASFGHGCGPGGAAVRPVWARRAVLGTAPPPRVLAVGSLVLGVRTASPGLGEGEWGSDSGRGACSPPPPHPGPTGCSPPGPQVGCWAGLPLRQGRS